MENQRFFGLVFVDVLGFIAGFLGFIFLSFPYYDFWNQLFIHGLSMSLLVAIWMIILYIFNFYDIQKSKPNIVFLKNLGIAGIVMIITGIVFFYLNPVTAITPKTNLLLFVTISLIVIFLLRRILYHFTKKSIHTRCAIICRHPSGEILAETFREHPELGFLCIGTYANTSSFLQDNPSVSLIIMDTQNKEDLSSVEHLLKMNCEVIDITEAYEYILYRIPVELITPEWLVHSLKRARSKIYNTTSRIIEIVFSLLVLIATLPITLVTAIAIKQTDSGPLFYKQKRVGIFGKEFSLIKFRSMVVDSEKNGAVWATVGDPRVTRVGKIIRKLHIDEIPQMWNILRGDIALVGPRPERPEFVSQLEKEIPYYGLRHIIKPGFTGWAQIKFRYARSISDSQGKFEYDLFYIKNRNIFLDLGIITKTVQIIFTHD